MRRALLILLVFAPAIVAAWIFRGWRDDSERRATMRGIDTPREETEDDPLDIAAFSGREGRDTFFIRDEGAVLDGETVRYPSAYYHLESWRRIAPRRYEVENLRVLLNQTPYRRQDLERILVVTNTEDPTRIRDRLGGGVPGATVVDARRALILSGRALEHVEGLELSSDVVVRAGLHDDGGQDYLVHASSATVDLAGERLRGLTLPDDFSIEDEQLTVKGHGLILSGDRDDLSIERNVDFTYRSRGSVSEAKDTLRATSAGPLNWQPLKPSEDHDPLSRLRFDDGSLTMRDAVVLTHAEFEIHGDRLDARLRRGPTGMQLDSTTLEGNVRFVGPGGTITGTRAHLRVADRGEFELLIEGTPVVVEWSSTVLSEAKLPRVLRATCDGSLMVTRTEAASDAFDIELERSVRLEIPRSGGATALLTGDRLDLTVRRVRIWSAELEKDRRSYELTRAEMTGDVRGDAPRESLESESATVTREFNADGLLLREKVDLAGPAVVDLVLVSRLGAQERRRIEASRRIVLERPDSPLEEAVVDADGEVRFRGAVGQAHQVEVAGESLLARFGPEDELGRRDLIRVEARTGARVADDRGSWLGGDVIVWDRALNVVKADGASAQVVWFDDKSRKQTLDAESIEARFDERRLIAKGNVRGKLRLPALILGSERKAAIAEAVRNLEVPPEDVEWTATAREIEVAFRDRAPLDETVRKAVGVREFTLTGGVRVDNEDQAIVADLLHHDFEAQGGFAEGEPVIVTARDGPVDGRFENRFESPRITVRRDWTLFEHHAQALFHVVAAAENGGGLEPLFASCDGELLVRSGLATLAGKSIVERGARARPHTRVAADGGAIRFADVKEGLGGFGTGLETIHGEGNVEFALEDVAGSGDVIDVDEVAKKVFLRAHDGRCRMTLRGRLMTAPRLVYDRRRKIIDVWRPVTGGEQDRLKK